MVITLIKVAVAFVQCIVARCSKVIRSHLHFKGKKQVREISTFPKALTVNGKGSNSELLIWTKTGFSPPSVGFHYTTVPIPAELWCCLGRLRGKRDYIPNEVKYGQGALREKWKFKLIIYCIRAQSLQLSPALCDPVDCGLPGSSVYRDSPSKNTGVVAMSSSRGSSQTREQRNFLEKE